MMTLPLCVLLAVLPGSVLKPVREIAEGVVPPPGFVMTEDRQKHGGAIISKELHRHWEGPNGIQMTLAFDDTEAIDSYGVAEQLHYAVEQTKQLYPAETYEAARIFVVNKREWILIRSRGDYHGTKYHHFIVLTQLQGQYITLHFTGADETRQEIFGYIEMVMRQVSGAKPDDPIRPL